ncbi:MAG: GNAT family N-acetyltransferase [Candidatus Micrarchaeota archaeon]|nr:GNAT family N-acetyltransferase [Candidatus Micrarchaeota archaeon]
MRTENLPEKLVPEDRVAFESLLSKLALYERRFKDKWGAETTIRTIRIADVPKIVKMGYEMWEEQPWNKGITQAGIRNNNLKASLQAEGPIALIAEQYRKPLGMIWGYDLSNHGRACPYPKNLKKVLAKLSGYLSSGSYRHVIYIRELAVEPGSRRKGIAGELLDSFVELAKQEGADDLMLDTNVDNIPAIKLYVEKKHYVPAIDPRSGRELRGTTADGDITRFLHLKLK